MLINYLFTLMLDQRYRILFFPRKSLCSLTHSNLGTSVFFFPKRGKKKYSCIFFFPGKVYVPLTQLFWRSLYKKIGGKQYFFRIAIFNPILRCIFFSRDLYFFPCIFFSWKSLSLTHSLISNVCIFLFPVSEKKKYSVFTHSLDFVKNVTKINFSKEIKKYGTFDEE